MSSSYSYRYEIDEAVTCLRNILLENLIDSSHWEGHLSSSALSTATALTALSYSGNIEDPPRLKTGLEWLISNQNSDGGWGDTTDSPSNLSTTLLVHAAILLLSDTHSNANLLDIQTAFERMLRWEDSILSNQSVDIDNGIRSLYGEDKTFAVPILMNCALAGLTDWRNVPELPFELAAAPERLFRFLKMGVVSYALPALISIGLLVEWKNPTSNPITGALRQICIRKALEKLEIIQPEHGGFLDATPLTSFVAMALANRFDSQHPVVQKCYNFLRWSMRRDGSWPIDTNLSIWLTSHILGVFCLTGFPPSLDPTPITEWLKSQQCISRHPYTGAEPGGWGWNHHPGSVPDADDTSSVLIALNRLGKKAEGADGLRWLLHLQNDDGGWPTFCRGWSGLPFDRSCPDITAHALRAIAPYYNNSEEVANAIKNGLSWLKKAQCEDGSWVPLWFGNQYAPDKENRVFGTSRVLLALGEMDALDSEKQKGIVYLLNAQNGDGGWGGGANIPSSMEETALSVIALLACGRVEDTTKGIDYLLRAMRERKYMEPTPIGLYFTSLWYSEILYPVLWTLEALGRYKLQKMN